jgi:hypothetical protein
LRKKRKLKALSIDLRFILLPSNPVPSAPYLIASDGRAPGEYRERQNINNVHNNTILSFVGEVDIKLSDQIAYRKRPATNHQTQRQWRPRHDRNDETDWMT